MLKDTAFLIISCDTYSGLWNKHFDCLDKNWPDCPFPKYLLSNKKDSGDSKISTIKVGEDRTWSANLKKAIQDLKKDFKYILATFDDLFLTENVDNTKLEKAIKSFKSNDGQFLQLIKWHNRPKKINETLGSIESGSLYRPNCVYALWNIEVLEDLLDETESAWEFERKGAQRSDKYNGFFVVLESIFKYRNVVIRGKITRKDSRIYGLRSIENLKVMNLANHLAFLSRLWSFKIFLFLIPRRMQVPLVRAKTKIIKQ